MATWEYHVESVDISSHIGTKLQPEHLEEFRRYLNGMGSQRWEMISYEQVIRTGMSAEIRGYGYLLFFKREQG
jgi:hypothetical protein